MITYLANTDEVTSREIEMGTNLQQPEVSIGMRTLRENNWVNERDVKVGGKGRPMKVYKLGVPIGEIIKHYEDVKNNEAAKTMQAIQRLKDIAATWSEGNFPVYYFAPKSTASSTAAKSFIRNILSFAVSLKATEFFKIWAYPDLGSFDHVAFQVLHLVVVEAIAHQEFEGIIPRASRFELEAI